tara:strand:- start:896 stop:1699 length:804 start_codon:yes stop_codon:yes gene_type:complete
MSDFIINDNSQITCFNHPRGLVKRDYRSNPVGCYSTSTPWSMEVPVIPKAEWSERIKDMEANKSRLSDIRDKADGGNQMESLDQNGQGFCWAYSTAACVMLLRAAANMPYSRLSPHSVACKIYNFRDRGAWGALSMEFMSENGIPEEKYWPQKSMSRQYDNPETWENAKKHRITEGWMDLNLNAYDRELSFEQVATCLLSRIPVVLDYNWWGHSVAGMDLVETSPGKFGVRILNSWTDDWGSKGTAVLEGKKAIPDGACAARVTIGA